MSMNMTRASSTESAELSRATFSMYCYWTGEATLGQLKGVKKTKIGSLDHNEVVEVFYDPKETNLLEMSQALKAHKSFYSLIYRNEQEKKQALQTLPKGQTKKGSSRVRYIADKHSLKVRRPDLYALNLTDEQAIKLNTWAHYNYHTPMPDILTTNQKKALKNNKNKR